MKITLKAARVSAGYTQAQAAKAVGVSVPTLRKWESQKSEPGFGKLMRLMHMYGTSLDDVREMWEAANDAANNKGECENVQWPMLYQLPTP